MHVQIQARGRMVRNRNLCSFVHLPEDTLLPQSMVLVVALQIVVVEPDREPADR